MFGRVSPDGQYSELFELGGPLLQAESTDPHCAETVPEEANVVAMRISSPILGGGLVEAIPDTTLSVLLASQPPDVRGRIHWVQALEDAAGPPRAGRFGFKAQIATVLSFSAKATRDELGLTNRFFPEENAPNGDPARSTPCDPYPDPEIRSDASGLDFVDRVADFQRLLAPPPQTPRSGMTGEKVFHRIGCTDCHTPLLRTADTPGMPPALRAREVRAYSDFLLHDMDDAADGIRQGSAGRTEMRTTPLWGFRIRFPVFHDGRVSGETVEERARRCIELHQGQGAASRDRFEQLSDTEQTALLAFLNALGRAEFDADGDNDVDADDVPLLVAQMHGPDARNCSADDRCAIVDVDQNGTVDLVDFALMQRAFSGPQTASALVVP